ncbi:hypothetical protein Hanom_Chr10g00939821 [Helianthus anomalus]
MRVIRFFRVRISQINPFDFSQTKHFEISCITWNRKPDLSVFLYFYKFTSAGDWFTFSHQKSVPRITPEERSS